MAKSKQLKVVKEKLNNQLDYLKADEFLDEVEVVCDDKECLLKSIMGKFDSILEEKKTTKKKLANGLI